MKKTLIIIVLLMLIQGCAWELKTKHSTLTISISPGELLQLYNLHSMTGARAACQITTHEGIIIKVE